MTAQNRLSNAYIPDIIPKKDIEYYERDGHGERIGWGDNPALVLIDMTEEFVALRPEKTEKTVEPAARLLSAAREAGIPVVFTRANNELPDGYRGTSKPKADSAAERSGTNEIHEAISPNDDEYVLEKPRASGFFDTHLANMLHEWSVDTIMVGGLITSGCVRSTVVEGHSSNFNVIVPQEATADRADTSHEVALFEMDMKYADVTPTDEVIDHLHSHT